MFDKIVFFAMFLLLTIIIGVPLATSESAVTPSIILYAIYCVGVLLLLGVNLILREIKAKNN